MLNNELSVACIQMTSNDDIHRNLNRAAELIRAAADQGAQFIATPENTDHMGACPQKKLADAYGLDNHPGVPFFSDLAKDLGITLLIGSMAIKEEGKLANRSFVFGADGSQKATYDKIHLFEVSLPSGEAHREADIYQGGHNAPCVQLQNDFMAGLTICYDLRFPHLYRALAQSGANILCVPAAFTVPTGQAHWEVLLRARAIETGCYVIAPAQVGEHNSERRTYGHSLIVSPWGEVLHDAALGEGVIIETLKRDEISKARGMINSLAHDRKYEIGIHK